jgi:CHAT domain
MSVSKNQLCVAFCIDRRLSVPILEVKSAGNSQSSVGNITVKLSLLASVENAVGRIPSRPHGVARSHHFLNQPTYIISDPQDASQLSDDDPPDTPAYHYKVGISKLNCFERLKQITDLDDCIANLNYSVLLTGSREPDYLGYLGMAQWRRYEHLGELADIEASITNIKKSIQLAPDGFSRKPLYFKQLGYSHRARYQCLGELKDIEACISHLQMSFQLTTDGHSNMPLLLHNIGLGFLDRYDHLSEPSDLEDAILNLERGVQIMEDGDPNKPMYLGNYGSSRMKRFMQLHELADLENAMENILEAVHLTDQGHPNKPTYLYNLGHCLQMRYGRLRKPADLDDSILYLRQAVQFTEDSHPNKQIYLHSLGISQQRRFECLGQLADIKDSVSNLQKAVSSCLAGYPDNTEYLYDLSNSQLLYFNNHGELATLEDCISNLNKAAELVDDGSPNKSTILSGLGVSQLKRFERLGELKDIEESISNLKFALQLTAHEHPGRPNTLGDLGISQLRLFECLGGLADLEHAISNLQESTDLTKLNDPLKPVYLSDLGLSKLRRFECHHILTDIDDSISSLKLAVQLTEDGHPNNPLYLCNLGMSQQSRFKSLGELLDLDDSISNLKEAIKLTDAGHPEKPGHFNNLGLSLSMRYEHLGELVDLEAAILHFNEAIRLTSNDFPERAKYFLGLGGAQLLHLQHQGESTALLPSISAFQAAAQLKTAYPRDAFRAAQAWANLAYTHNDILSALDGYRMALDILPRVAWLGLSALAREDLLIQAGSGDLACLAATCAIQLGRLEEAVELLDLGRTVFWQQSSTLRADFEVLKDKAPGLACEIKEVGQKLDAWNFSGLLPHVKCQSAEVNGTEEVDKERRSLVGKWEVLVERVRQIPQLEHFLRPMPFCQLRQAVADGLVIIINVSRYKVDALIFDADHQIDHVPLPNTDFETLHIFGLNVMRRQPINPSAIQQRNYNARYLKPALRHVWNDILIPIFDKIQITLNDSGAPHRRIWWYSTGPLTFIPIHAAGPGKGEIDVSHLVISSYVTTLSSLVQARKKHGQDGGKCLKLLAVSQPDTPNLGVLPSSIQEIAKIVKLVSSAGLSNENIICLNGSDAIVENVSDALDSCSWAHFACHGMSQGINSTFSLYDGELHLGQIASKRLPTAQFAFLSVCHAATGHPGEAMHLAGGFQFSGFPSVIATMWRICDEDAPIVAESVYQHLFRNGLTSCDPAEAATALNHAVLHLREDPSVTVDRWAPFIHFGI